MDFKYVPIIRNRSAERTSIIKQSYSNKILPLLEMVVDKPTFKSKYNYFDDHTKFFDDIKSKILVDIPMNIEMSLKTIKNIRTFLKPIYDNPSTRVDYLKKLSSNASKFIPVISYNPNKEYNNGFLRNQEKILRSDFKNLAFRLFSKHSINAANEIIPLLKDDDIILIDIEKPYSKNDKKLIELYKSINNLKTTKKIKTVIIHTAIPKTFKKSSMVNQSILNEISTDLLKDFKTLNFDAFGDYCGIKNLPLENTKAVYPSYIHYNGQKNVYVGFKGNFNKPITFTTKVLPIYTTSSCWNSISSDHIDKCCGCKKILAMQSGKSKINSARTWKSITISHHIREMDEIL